MADYALAAAYVAAHGTAVDVGRMAALLGGPTADVDVTHAIDQLSTLRGPQGGFPAPWSAAAESVDATCARLDQLSDLGASADELQAHALIFLSGRQRVDGSIVEEELAGRLAPEWAAPDSPRSVRYLTAHAGYWLSTSPAHPGSATAAAEHLSEQMDQIAGPESYVATMWLAAALFGATGRTDAAAELERGLAVIVEDLGADSLTWLAHTMPDSEVANGARFRLRWRQEADGRWTGEQGPGNDVAVTVAAVRALLVGDRSDDTRSV